MRMPGNWTMSMMWMMGRGWRGAAAFSIMWLAMMVAMMLPSTLPMLQLYYRLTKFQKQRALAATSVAAAGYFFVWSIFGIAAWACGTGIAHLAMRSAAFSRAVPLATAAALLGAGAYQLTRWKQACLRHCRDPLLLLAKHGHHGGAWQLGVHHGAFCAACCWGLMLIQLSLGVMDLWLMTLVAAAIAAEKLLPRGALLARWNGVAAILLGCWVAAQVMASA
jgi:predicted metal-binding membrane protein